MKYRKKPVVIHAVRWDGKLSSIAPLLSLLGTQVMELQQDYRTGAIMIPTLEGVMRAEHGDWIIRGVKGELYPCKPDIFEATYDPA